MKKRKMLSVFVAVCVAGYGIGLCVGYTSTHRFDAEALIRLVSLCFYGLQIMCNLCYCHDTVYTEVLLITCKN